MRWKSDRRALGDVEGNRWEMSEGSERDAREGRDWVGGACDGMPESNAHP